MNKCWPQIRTGNRHADCVGASVSQGLQISAAGAMTALYRQDVFANNLANMDSVGFKPDMPSQYARPAVRQEDGIGWMPSNALLERLGGGVMLNPNRVHFGQGSVRITGRELDVAMEGKGFLVVRDSTNNGDDQVRLTRDGRLSRNARGELVMAGSGLPVLGVNGNPIQLQDSGEITIDTSGRVSQAGKQVAQIRLIEVHNEQQLRKIGNSLFAPTAAMVDNAKAASGLLKQGALEESGVDEVRALLQMTSASREVDANVDMMRTHDRLMERAIASLGRGGNS
jgi:flagellar basal-body rod protein FlgF